MNDIIPRHRFTFFGILLVTSILFSSVAPAFGQISIARVFNHPYNGQTWGIHARGNYLYVGNTYGFYTWDITDIENPSLSNSQDGNWVNDVVDINDTYGLVGTQDGLQTLNLSDPGSPTFVGTTAGTYNDQVIVLNNLVYIADRNVGVRIYNIESLPALQLAGTVQLSGALGITFYNNRLYVCTWSGEIVEYDLSVSLTQPNDVVQFRQMGWFGEFWCGTMSCMRQITTTALLLGTSQQRDDLPPWGIGPILLQRCRDTPPKRTISSFTINISLLVTVGVELSY